MKQITLTCAILWAVAALFSFYNLTFGYSPIVELFSDSVMDGLESIVWFLSDITMAVFFYVLWTKQG
ncbi:MAG: hypothetical protein GQ547_08860 [Methylophaga sp.]|nr:hypothetical protein [Methylophaga sp.]